MTDGAHATPNNDEPGPPKSDPKVYLAGPDVFHPEATQIGAKKKALCEAHGLIGLYPLDNEIGAVEITGAAPSGAIIAARIYAANIAMLEVADAVIANVSPFLGACADDGTAFEIGFAAARGLPVALYDNGAGDTASKAAAFRAAAPEWPGAALEAEDFGLPVNLMLAIPAFDARLIIGGETALAFDDLSRFEQALAALADHLTSRS
ncbi:MAG: nucleoside 2-deoxyribosyltransferase [Pseudomonadota bacterium]